MKVVAFDWIGWLLKADVVEACERRSTDVFNCVIGDEKVLLKLRD